MQWSELEDLLMADGRFWYFRSRGSHASLGVGRTPDEAIDDESLDIPIDGPEFTASWLSPNDTAEAFFRLLSQR